MTERRRVQESLEKSEARYRLLADYATDMIARYSLQGVFEYISPACRVLLDALIKAVAGKVRAVTVELDDQAEAGRNLAASHPLRILLAEDNITNQKVATLMLERLGYQPDVVANGLEVLDALERRQYDLVLLDIAMPEMSGLEVAELIRQRFPHTRQPWLVALTAHVLPDDRERFLAAGMDDYLSKPVRIHELEQAVLRCCSRQGSAANGSGPTGDELDAESALQQSTSIDLQVLEELGSGIGEGGIQVIRELIGIYLAEGQQLINDMERGVEDEDAERLRLAAHTLKSGSATLGARELSAMCQELERTGDPRGAAGGGSRHRTNLGRV